MTGEVLTEDMIKRVMVIGSATSPLNIMSPNLYNTVVRSSEFIPIPKPQERYIVKHYGLNRKQRRRLK